MYRRRDYSPEPPPTPALLFGQLAFTLAVFILIAVLVAWHRPPACDPASGQTDAACVQQSANVGSSSTAMPDAGSAN